ncbi:MAG: hypothetical protein R2836_04425 [Chitinophagales bacterium]
MENNSKRKEKIVGHRVVPKSFPLFQEFKIWTILNNIELTHQITKEKRTLEIEKKKNFV